eukprot:9478817-Pyramimonas_sp.AAC.1
MSTCFPDDSALCLNGIEQQKHGRYRVKGVGSAAHNAMCSTVLHDPILTPLRKRVAINLASPYWYLSMFALNLYHANL